MPYRETGHLTMPVPSGKTPQTRRCGVRRDGHCLALATYSVPVRDFLILGIALALADDAAEDGPVLACVKRW